MGTSRVLLCPWGPCPRHPWCPKFQHPSSPALVARWHQVAARDQHGELLRHSEGSAESPNATPPAPNRTRMGSSSLGLMSGQALVSLCGSWVLHTAPSLRHPSKGKAHHSCLMLGTGCSRGQILSFHKTSRL